jgi:hypothetical protein
MSTITEDKIHSAWLKLVNSVLDRENIDLSCATYDGTNFYSFIGSFNTRCSVAKRGKNKQVSQLVVTKMDEVQQRLFDLFGMEKNLSS